MRIQRITDVLSDGWLGANAPNGESKGREVCELSMLAERRDSSPLTPAGVIGAKPLPSVSKVAAIKAQMKIEDLVAQYTDLVPSGDHHLIGRCPFHDDHSPSLWLNPQSNLWGCNRPDCPASGTHDVINFRALFRDISNRTAIKQLAGEFL